MRGHLAPHMDVLPEEHGGVCPIDGAPSRPWCTRSAPLPRHGRAVCEPVLPPWIRVREGAAAPECLRRAEAYTRRSPPPEARVAGDRPLPPQHTADDQQHDSRTGEAEQRRAEPPRAVPPAGRRGAGRAEEVGLLRQRAPPLLAEGGRGPGDLPA